jgi:hypothetical protein
MKVQFLSFEGCPGAAEALASLEAVLRELECSCEIEKIDLLAESTGEDLRRWGSPTILIDGVDLAGGVSSDAACCRLYENARRAPAADRIREFLVGARTPAQPHDPIEGCVMIADCSERQAQRNDQQTAGGAAEMAQHVAAFEEP